MIYYFTNYLYIQEWGTYAAVIILLLVYKKLRLKQWRKILRKSIEYHKFHLTSICKDSTANHEVRELARSLLWGITKQLPLDLKEGKGGSALINSFSGRKTSLNTCGTVFYECAKNPGTMDSKIFKLNNTLTSTIYRIYILESAFSVSGLLYNDIIVFLHLLTKSEAGNGRFYFDMKKALNRIGD